MLIFHRVVNKLYGRYHNTFFEKYYNFLKKDRECKWIDYAQTEDSGWENIRLESIDLEKPISDVDCVIEDTEKKEFYILSFTEYFNSYIVHLIHHEACKKVLLTHFSWHNIYYWCKKDNLTHKLNIISPWIFGSHTEYDIDYYRKKRTENNEDKIGDMLFFKGSGQGYRKAITILQEYWGVVDNSSLTQEQYFENLIKHEIALSYYQDLDKYATPYDHQGEFCYRDMEYMALGVPFIRIEYRDAVYNGLIPNYHYISISREKAYETYKKNGDEGVSELIFDTWQEVKDDKEFLNYISKNQIKWFDKYIRWPNSALLTNKLLFE